jgi:hypothetical protein
VRTIDFAGTGGNPSVYIGRLTTPTSTGSVSYAGVGFTPKVIIFFSRGDATGHGTTLTQAEQMFGALGRTGAGAISQWSSTRFSADAANPSQARGQFSTTQCCNHQASSTTTLFAGTATSIDTDGFTISWTTVNATARVVDYVAIGGTNISASVGNFNNLAAVGAQSITGVGFVPSFLLFKSDFASGTVHDDLGVCSANLTQWAVSNFDANASAPTNSRTIWSDTKALYRWGAGAAQYEAAVTSMDSDGFTINCTANDANIRPYGYIAFFGVSAYPTIIQSAGAAETRSYTGASFTPNFLFVASTSNTATAAGTQQQDSFRGYGVAVGSSQLNYSYMSTGNVTPSDCATRSTNSKVVDTYDALGNPLLGASFSAFTSAGFDLTWSTSLGAIRVFCCPLRIPGDGHPTVRKFGDMEIAAGETHYMTVPHSSAGVGYASWTKNLFKNGEVVLNTAIDMRESPSGTYTFAFVNDKEDEAQWTLQVWETANTTIKYSETWRVKKKLIEQGVKQIRSRMDSEGGFFQSSTNQDK